MNPFDESQFGQIQDLDAARLALRGAVATIRDLQDLSVRLKGEIQEASNREKLAVRQIDELKAQTQEWRAEAQKWEEERGSEAQRLERFKNQIRIEVREEEGARMAAESRQAQDELQRLTRAVEDMRRQTREKEGEWLQLKRLLEERDNQLLAAQREKMEISQRFNQDADAVERLRRRRDEEISAIVRDREAELADSQMRLTEARRKNEELARVLAAHGQEIELRLQEREEQLVKEHRAKELALQEKYSRREAELQSAWSDLENGLWDRTKQARETLDRTVQAQFDERARAMADRTRETEAALEARRQELDELFHKRLKDLDDQQADKERRALESYGRREAALLKRFDEELAREKGALVEHLRERNEAAERDHHDRMEALERKEADLGREVERRRQQLEAEYAQREAQAQLEWSGKEKTLEQDYQKRRVALEEESLARETELREEWGRKRAQLLEDHDKALESERSVLKAEVEAEVRHLDEAYRTKTAELERSHQALEEQFASWKSSVLAQYVQKEKDLDKRWFEREQELVRRYETTLEQERRAAGLESDKTREHIERIRRREEEDFFNKAEALKLGYERLEREIKEAFARREDEASLRRTADLDELRARHKEQIAQHAKHLENELLRQAEESKAALARTREQMQQQSFEAERTLSERDLLERALKERITRLEEEKREISGRVIDLERKSESERLSLEESFAERHVEADKHQQKRERMLQQAWEQQNKASLEEHRLELERQRQAFEVEKKRLEDERRLEREAHAQELGRQEESLERRFREWQKKTASEFQEEKEAWLERQRRALAHEREILQKRLKPDS